MSLRALCAQSCNEQITVMLVAQRAIELGRSMLTVTPWACLGMKNGQVKCIVERVIALNTLERSSCILHRRPRCQLWACGLLEIGTRLTIIS